jgi:hypothetical protein
MVKWFNNGTAVIMDHGRDESQSSCLVGTPALSLPARLTSDWGVDSLSEIDANFAGRNEQ